MTRTWDENRATINGLWPMIDLTDDEIDLWHADLSGLDQDVLFEAIREVKRSKESIYPQLVWVHAAYRTLMAARRAAERDAIAVEPAFVGEKLEIDAEQSRAIAAEIAFEIEAAGPEDVDAILAKLQANVDRIDAVVASRLAWRAGARRRVESKSPPESVRRPEHVDEVQLASRRADTLRVLRDAC